MDVDVRGDFEKLARVSLGLERVSRQLLPSLTRVIGAEALVELRAGMAEGRGADGVTWKRTTEGKLALQGGMPGSWGVTASRTVASLRTQHEGAGTHQKGMVIRPKRGRRGRDAAGRFTSASLGVLVFTVGGQRVFARKVTIPKRRTTPLNGTLGRWAPRLVSVAESTLRAEVKIT